METHYRSNPAMFRNNPLFFCVACIGIFVVVGIPVLLIWWLHCKGTTLEIDDERTTLRTGIFSKHTNEVLHEHVRNVKIDQTMMQRIFKVGKIGISSAGQADIEIQVSGMRAPAEVKNILDRLRRQESTREQAT